MNQKIGVKFVYNPINPDENNFSNVKLIFNLKLFDYAVQKLINDLIWLNRACFKKYYCV
jgi:hypothetical protein